MKTEKEKMLAGEPYQAFDPVLVAERQAVKEHIFKFNNLPPSEVEKRNEILKQLLGSMGDNYYFEPPFRCDYGYNIEIGDNFYTNYNLVVLDCAKVSIGDSVLIGPNVGIFTAGHPLHHEIRIQEWEHAYPISIGNKVWIGGQVVINPGVSIGENSVIGSGSVVTKDIPSNVFAAGNPCRVIRAITEEDKNSYLPPQKA
ncbi:sugar O-acetyltransferase [Salinimicrobium tongyeongense]|uniref:Acetyltransferase n=1 Tax=Salinimicrobium tongyeongense TaxID=2809707 RepID=A0ABY6NR31_9FLAO|nr:sugar O-acetyltransferase [Salinimicrobium tongyeongense]UZH55371.1 sugar O-acetyltransferase [Salinimicrobium tongyeongense]